MKILLIAAQKDFIKNIQSYLNKIKESDIETVNSLEEGTKLIRENHFDAIIFNKLNEEKKSELLDKISEENENPPLITIKCGSEGKSKIEFIWSEKEGYKKYEKLEKEKYENQSQEKKFLHSLLEKIPDSIYFKDRKARFVEISKAKAEHLGEKREKVIGKTDFDFYPEEQAQKMYEDDMRVIGREKTIVNGKEKITRPNGEERWVSVTKVPRYDEEGDVIGLLGISRDITERVETKQRLDFESGLIRHDLRNKIQIVRGYLQFLGDTNLSEEQAKYLEKAQKTAKSDYDLIEKVRGLRKIEKKQRLRSVDVPTVVERVVKDNKELAEREGMEIESEIEGELKIKGDYL